MYFVYTKFPEIYRYELEAMNFTNDKVTINRMWHMSCANVIKVCNKLF